ncbi:hypothetical protein KCH_05580 [Kitasatospora cheerisanensis KCTC 2395]|uniref:CHAT domain-containing protein n=2 Tax=Kitasatospora cheerisanensis TaxID=81942 RepID=A0A066ZBM3_9ACTN|nr:hypothetical protein KCH_05580 [Kitasatospora cheerisanensis KCTC 2395]
MRRQHAYLARLLDALADDRTFAAWLREEGPAHWSVALWALKALSYHWSARATDPERALLIARRCVEIAHSLDGPWPDGDEEDMGRARLLAVTLEGLADVTTELGRYTEAYDLLRAAEQWLQVDQGERTRAGKDLWTAFDQVTGTAPNDGLYRKLAAAARRSGDDAGAEHWARLHREHEEAAPVRDHDRMVAIVDGAMRTFADGDPELALRRLSAAQAIAEEEFVRSPVKVAMATVRHAFGLLHTSLGLPRTALEHFAAARALNAGNADRLAADWIATAAVLKQWPDFGRVTTAYEQVLVLSSVAGGRRGERLFWAPRGEPTAATGRRIVAVERAWSIVLPMAQEAWREGELYTATDVLTLGADLADLVRAAQPDPAVRIRVQDERAHVHELLTRYRLERAARQQAEAAEHIAGAYLAAERKRARALIDAMSTARLRAPAGLPPALLAREAALLRARAETETAGRVDWTRHHRLSGELDRLWERIAAHGPEAAEYTAIRRADVMTPADVRAELAGENVLVASYALLDDGQVVLFALDAERGLRAGYVDADGPRMLRFVEDHFGSAGQVRELAEDLPGLLQHELAPLVAPLAEAAAPGQTVLICPTGSLHHVPFHALAVPGHPTLLDRNPVGYLPTVSLLRTLNRRTPATGSGAVVLGDPGRDLPHARAEAAALAARLGTAPLLGDAATRERVLRAAPGAAVLHAACHARFDAADPLASGLVLADGVLTARDILQQDWHSVRLAVLSACETGIGRTSRTDETLGLSRALLFAGVRSLVMSLWRVPDRTTAALMGDFHDLTRAGTAPAPALRAAMLAARDRPGGDRLDRWAAFCLLGDWRAPARPDA